jgi:hypothetical protein
MTANTTPNSEPTLSDIIEQIEELSNEVKRSSDEVKKSNERFAEYRQATQWVVQLAFALITSATITVIITSVFK